MLLEESSLPRNNSDDSEIECCSEDEPAMSRTQNSLLEASVSGRARWKKKEDGTLMEAHRKWGNCWTKIAKLIPGRTDVAVKNRFRTLTRKRKQSKGQTIDFPAAGSSNPRKEEGCSITEVSQQCDEIEDESVSIRFKDEPQLECTEDSFGLKGISHETRDELSTAEHVMDSRESAQIGFLKDPTQEGDGNELEQKKSIEQDHEALSEEHEVMLLQSLYTLEDDDCKRGEDQAYLDDDGVETPMLRPQPELFDKEPLSMREKEFIRRAYTLGFNRGITGKRPRSGGSRKRPRYIVSQELGWNYYKPKKQECCAADLFPDFAGRHWDENLHTCFQFLMFCNPKNSTK